MRKHCIIFSYLYFNRKKEKWERFFLCFFFFFMRAVTFSWTFGKCKASVKASIGEVKNKTSLTAPTADGPLPQQRRAG